MLVSSVHTIADKDDDKSSKNADEKREPLEKKKASKEENGTSNSTTSSDNDYDTTQGFPILFPETHMIVNMKRNNTQGDVNTTASISTTDDEPSNEARENTKCSKSLDLLFLLDSSESVKYSNWKLIIQFVKDISNRFQLKSSRVGIIRYASDAEVALPLTQFNDTATRNSTIDDVFYKTGGTRTDLALQKADEVFSFEEQRSQVVILVTDGPTNRLEINKNHFVEGKDLVAGPASRLKEAGVVLFCIGVEPDSLTPDEIETMKDEMRLIASEPTKHHLFISDGYHELERKVEGISRAACVVNGAWSAWSEFSPCSITCGYGTKVRMRTCSNPSPENNGAECNGNRVEIDECRLDPCSFQSPHTRPSSLHLHPTTMTFIVPHSKEFDEKKDAEVPYLTNTSLVRIDKNETEDYTARLNGSLECHTLEEVKLNDTQYSSSSTYSHDTNDEYVKKEYGPSNAKLNNQINGGAWCAEHKFAVTGDKNQYLQMDLGKPVLIYAVGTQGSHLSDNWVLKYMVRYSDDGRSWKFYSQNPLTGNTDKSTVHHNLLSPPLKARYFQLNPLEWNQKNGTEQHDICLRAALFQCKDSSKLDKTNVTTTNNRRDVIMTQLDNLPHLSSSFVTPSVDVPDTPREVIPQGVILREQAVMTPRIGQKPAKIVLTSYIRRKRLYSLKDHQAGNKRILKRLQKTAKCIIRKIWKKKCT